MRSEGGTAAAASACSSPAMKTPVPVRGLFAPGPRGRAWSPPRSARSAAPRRTQKASCYQMWVPSPRGRAWVLLICFTPWVESGGHSSPQSPIGRLRRGMAADRMSAGATMRSGVAPWMAQHQPHQRSAFGRRQAKLSGADGAQRRPARSRLHGKSKMDDSQLRCSPLRGRLRR